MGYVDLILLNMDIMVLQLRNDFTEIVHENAVSSNGDCSSIGEHFDPYAVGPSGCDPSKPETCQVICLLEKVSNLRLVIYVVNMEILKDLLGNAVILTDS
jgi:hypothetical protein